MDRKRPSSLTQEVAEHLAIQALSFIAAEPERLGTFLAADDHGAAAEQCAEPERLGTFLAATGIGPDRIRAAAREPGFLGGVLDYLAGNETLLLDFAAEAGFAPDLVEKARMVLGDRDWERDMP